MENFKIYQGFTNRYGQTFNNIRNIAFTSSKEILKFGTYKNQTERNLGYFQGSYDQEAGVFIYQTPYDENKALRIFKDYKNSEGIAEDRLVSKLLTKQPNIKLTDFPTGIVSLDGKLIGHEIVYYKDAYNIFEYYTKNKGRRLLPTQVYRKILINLKELLENDIAYLDIHNKNFMILNETEEIKIIDFEKMEMEFDENISTHTITRLINNLRMMMKRTNEIAGVCDVIECIPVFNNIDDAFQVVDDMHKKLIIK